LYREHYDFGDPRFERLSGLSVAQLYRLRQSRAYRQKRIVCQPTRPTPVSIGEWRRRDTQGRPGYLRVDTVHQGDDLDGNKGVYHINAVDEVTQWEVVRSTSDQRGLPDSGVGGHDRAVSLRHSRIPFR
jgi:hypothetical protein